MNFETFDFSNARVLVIGDVMLDRYWQGDTSRISPEAPVPVIKVEQVEDRLGGAANVARNIASLGAHAILIGIIGTDEAGHCLKILLQKNNVESHLLEKNVRSITKLRVMGRSQQLIRCDFEEDYSPHESDILKSIQSALAQVDIIVLSDYAKGTIVNAQAIIQLAQTHGIPVLVDPKSKDFSVYKGADCVTPNFQEFINCVGHCSSEDIIEHKAQTLIQQGFKNLLVTRGSQGMTLYQEHVKPYHIPSCAREVYDITGAGDTVIATLAVALAVKYSYPEAVQIANSAAGIVVGKLGTATVSREELVKHWKGTLGENVKIYPKSILSNSTLSATLQSLKNAHKKIVMTNGCFDVLHAGHIKCLQYARSLGDVLIVAINDDASIKRLKGDSRPYYSLLQRMEILCALSCVDYVIPFAEDTPQTLIEAILPDVLLKGGDYTISSIAGADAVQKNGGQVVLFDLVPDCSTTDTLRKMQIKKDVVEVQV